jgi:ClpP class serine protease
MDLSNGLALVINSPGGDGIAAERIVNICREYSGTEEYWAVVPGRAKSAATMICMGASKILMAPSSELGPIDPQIIRNEDGKWRRWSAHNLVQSYNNLFNRAVRAKGNMHPYLQQLGRYDERDIEGWKADIQLSEQIATKLLQSGMMKGENESKIKKNIKVFIDPSAGTIAHGRPIYSIEAASCKLNIENIDVDSPCWKVLYQLYVRSDNYVSRIASKVIENGKDSFAFPPMEMLDDN